MKLNNAPARPNPFKWGNVRWRLSGRQRFVKHKNGQEVLYREAIPFSRSRSYKSSYGKGR